MLWQVGAEQKLLEKIFLKEMEAMVKGRVAVWNDKVDRVGGKIWLDSIG